jgi:transcriptional regulator with XRE-family HTH domain
MKKDALVTVLLPQLGGALRYLREQRKLKQTELSERANMGKSQISDYENGKRPPSLDSLLRLLAALSYDFHDLHNALQIVAENFDQVCHRGKERGEGGAAEHFAQGFAILFEAVRQNHKE